MKCSAYEVQVDSLLEKVLSSKRNLNDERVRARIRGSVDFCRLGTDADLVVERLES